MRLAETDAAHCIGRRLHASRGECSRHATLRSATAVSDGSGGGGGSDPRIVVTICICSARQAASCGADRRSHGRASLRGRQRLRSLALGRERNHHGSRRHSARSERTLTLALLCTTEHSAVVTEDELVQPDVLAALEWERNHQRL